MENQPRIPSCNHIETRAKHFGELLLPSFMILRIGCLPSGVLGSFVPEELSAGLHKYTGLRAEFKSWQRERTEFLEKLVPLAPDDSLRTDLIRLKRDIHNSRKITVTTRMRDWAPATDLLIELDEFCRLQKALEDCKCVLAKLLESAQEHIIAVLARCWEMEDFRRGVSAASPSFASHVKPNWRTGKKKELKKTARTLFSYVTRAAAKTSPFSTLTGICVLPLSGFAKTSVLASNELKMSTESTLNRSMAASLKCAFLQRNAEILPVPMCLSPHVFLDTQRIYGMCHRYQSRQKSLWLEQYPASFKVSARVEAALGQLPKVFYVATLKEALLKQGMEEGGIGRIVSDLVGRDIVRPQLEWDGNNVSPVETFRRDLEELGGEPARGLASSLASMDRIAESFHRCDEEERNQAFRDVAAIYESEYEKHSPLTPPPVSPSIYEDSWIENVEFQAGKGFQRIFTRLGEALGNNVFVSFAYRWLRKNFIETYGKSGSCENIPRFLMECWQRINELETFKKELAGYPDKESEEHRFGGVPIDKLEVPLTLYIQIAAENLVAIEQGDPQIIINLAYNRIGWQTARLCKSRRGSDLALHERLASWLVEASAPKTPVSISVSAESSSLQYFRRCTDHQLILDGNVGPRDLTLKDLVLRHNAATNLLELATLDGASVQTFYLGGAVPIAAWGPRYLAILIGEPFAVGRPDGSLFSLREDAAEVRFNPRIEENGCVFVRANWIIPSNTFLARVNRQSALERLIDAWDFRQEHGIPRFVYAKGGARSWSGHFSVSTQQKPFWLDFENTACLDAIMVLASSFDWIILTEALPDPARYFFEAGGENYVSELKIEMLLRGKKTL